MWERLRVFEAVARLGSVRAAAEELHVTGPAVSQHLRRLEKEAGCTLVEAHGRGIRLTHAGRVLADSAQAMAGSAARARRELAAVKGLVGGPLRIGAVASVLRALVPQTLVALTARHPRLAPRLRDGEAADMLPLLHTRQLDAVVFESWSHAPTSIPPGVRTQPLVEEPALLAVHAAHPFAGQREVRLADLTGLPGQPWTSCAAGSDAHHALLQLLRQHGVTDARIHFEVADYTTQLQLVAAGLATALIPRMTGPLASPEVRLLPCTPAVTRTVVVATTAADAETPTVRTFLEELGQAAGKARHLPRTQTADTPV